MNTAQRQLIVFVLAIVAIGAYLRFREDLKSFAPGSELNQPIVDESGDLIVWRSDRHAGQAWANLGPNGKVDYPEKSGIGGNGKALTICISGDGIRDCGLNWKGWFPADSCDDVSRYHSLVFHVRQETTVGEVDLAVALVDNVKRGGGVDASNTISIVGDGAISRIDGTWRRVVIPLSRFAQNQPLRLDRLWEVKFIHNGKGNVVYQIDRIGFSMDKGSAKPNFPSQPPYRAMAKLDLDAPWQKVADGIYGVSQLPEERLRQFGIPITRFGGNTTSRYNWKINADNRAADYFFRNHGTIIRDLNETAYLKQLRTAQSAGGTAYITVPMLGWVAKDFDSYSFSVRKYGVQKQVDPAISDAGNGILPDGNLIKNADPSDTSVAVGPEFLEESVAFVVRQAGKADATTGRGGVKYWVLDNEPMLWNKTHRDVRHDPLGYDELWERTLKYAEAIKKADPSAKVAGFCSWGWTDLHYSAKDEGNNNYATQPDFQAHGGVPLAEWFIRKCGEYKRKNGKALVDVFDFHWYPEGRVKDMTPYLGKGMDQKLNELRLRSTRELYDINYLPESWIRDASQGQSTRVIRRVQAWIERHNPGMELCLGEYNFGGGDNITGGLAQADTFGILAREKVDLAFIWKTPEGTQSLAWNLFRNYDDRGGRFGDMLIPVSTDNSDLAVYAAKRRDGATTIVAINKNLGGACDLTIATAKLKGKMRAWRFDQSSENVFEVEKESRNVDGSFNTNLPAASATIFVVK